MKWKIIIIKIHELDGKFIKSSRTLDKLLKSSRTWSSNKNGQFNNFGTCSNFIKWSQPKLSKFKKSSWTLKEDYELHELYCNSLGLNNVWGQFHGKYAQR